MLLENYKNVEPYITKDGSEIRELMHPNVHGNQNQSLAEARLPVDCTTLKHRHHQSEEIYYVIQGSGHMWRDEEKFQITAGDVITIPPETSHYLHNNGTEELVILCACSPAYQHHDTELIDA